jgi:uncharacterized membrane protein (UPF0127 family)
LIRISSRDLPILSVRIKNVFLFCEHPVAQQDRAKGLMGRPFLFEHRGMLFDTYGTYKPLFTMRDVRFDLEAIFVGNDMTIKDIVPMRRMDASTAYTTPLRVPIKWVIEVNKGWCDSKNIKIGDKVFI